jgi:Beta-ketoacyl synthase, N-terminal domain
MRVFIEGIGVIGPGLDGWPQARPVLAGSARYEPTPVRPPPVALLPPAERRRAGTTVKLAIAAGIEALAQAARDPADMAMVFAASGGDGETVDHILTVLSTPQREVSPTRFHNSVHNAPSGYWSVATGSQAPSTSLCAFDHSFAAGILEAAVQATTQDCPITLIAYDVPYPEPLHAARPIVSAFGMALVLLPCRTERVLASLTLAITDAVSPATAMTDPQLERLRLGNPAARALPLLAAIARGDAGTIRLDGISIEVTPP